MGVTAVEVAVLAAAGVGSGARWASWADTWLVVLPALLIGWSFVAVGLFNIRMPPTNTDDGLRAAVTLRSENPGLGVLVLSQHVETVYAQELFETGAEGVGYLLKDRVGDIIRFVDSVRQVGQGGAVLDPDVVAVLLGNHQAGTPMPTSPTGNAP